MAADNLLFAVASEGSPVTLPAGFMYASFSPAPGVTYTITNSLQTNPVSGNIRSAFTMPVIGTDGYAQHIITATGGDVIVVYVTGI